MGIVWKGRAALRRALVDLLLTQRGGHFSPVLMSIPRVERLADALRRPLEGPEVDVAAVIKSPEAERK
jgi:hypothetical protein